MEKQIKCEPFDLKIALDEPERVMFRNGEKPLEWHYFKHSTGPYPIVAIAPNGYRGGMLQPKENYTVTNPNPETSYWPPRK